MEDPRERLRLYVNEFGELLRLGATKEQLLNGASEKHGLNHVNEAFMMLPDGKSSAEFKIKE